MALAEFLLSEIAKDEAVARDAKDCTDGEQWNAVDGAVRQGDRMEYPVVDWAGDAAPHIARFDPTRVLAECQSKRVIVEHAACEHCPDDPMLEWVLRVMSWPYADRPGYREEWKP